MTTFELDINGKTREVAVDPDMPLLWVLRDYLDLVGTKYGCGTGLCGACTILVDGEPVRSCLAPVSAVKGKVTTIEGISSSATGRRVQKAWVELDVPQCGYCQGGQILAATALLDRRQAPSDTQIDNAMSGHLCRCGTYNRVRAAIKQAAEDKAL